jgi:hypothetical protein
MPRIVISYRREDSGVISGRIFDRLVTHYGRDSIFRDIDDIPAGVDFRQHINGVLDESDIVLAIVGPRWLGPRGAHNRLSNEADPVRVEIETVLRKGVPLIPLLVLRAAMPQPAQLPESLRDFAYRNAILVDAGQDFDTHMTRLLRAMDGILGQSAEPAPALVGETAAVVTASAPPQRHRVLIGGSIAALLGVAVVAGWYFGGERQRLLSPADTAAVVAPPPAVSPSNTAPATPSAPLAPPPVDPEIVRWRSIAASTNAADFEEYLSRYPQGQFAGLARDRLAALQPPPVAVPPEPPPSFKSAAVCGRSIDYSLVSSATAFRYAKYLGVWSGFWNNKSQICGGLIIQSVDGDGAADAIYVYGPGPSSPSFPWKQQRVVGHFDGDQSLSFLDEQGGKFSFSIVGPDDLDGFFLGKSGHLESHFRRVD